MKFPTHLPEIEDRIKAIDVENYGSTRNFLDGSVTHLSPYISRGVISTYQIFEHVKALNLPWHQMEKFVQELAWRDYWQQVWVVKKDEINQDLKQPQQPIANYGVPKAIVDATTGIHAVDKAIKELYATGYMHNHMRMYVAAICSNVANFHWLAPAKWLYSLLLDGDLASNQLSWQWVAGAFSSKKYYANQENINKYFYTNQKNTFLDVEYSEFEIPGIPDTLQDTVKFNLETNLPNNENPAIEQGKKTLIYNYYNLDPYWHKNEDVQRIFLMERSFFQRNPVSQHCVDFALNLTKNVKGIKVYVGEFSELFEQIGFENLVYKEHPTSSHYKGNQEERFWLSNVKGYFPSFFSFWKKCLKEIKPTT